MDNPNIPAQERHNNRLYLPGPFEYRPHRGCRECGEMSMKKEYIGGLCDECREKSEALTEAVDRLDRMKRGRLARATREAK